MAKKRVYELAKEMGIDNRELIVRLEKIGIAVKSHSSTLEEGDMERIQRELLSGGSRELVEQRIKSGVIRRRAVRVAAVEPAVPEPPLAGDVVAPAPEAKAPPQAPHQVRIVSREAPLKPSPVPPRPTAGAAPEKRQAPPKAAAPDEERRFAPPGAEREVGEPRRAPAEPPPATSVEVPPKTPAPPKDEPREAPASVPPPETPPVAVATPRKAVVVRQAERPPQRPQQPPPGRRPFPGPPRRPGQPPFVPRPAGTPPAASRGDARPQLRVVRDLMPPRTPRPLPERGRKAGRKDTGPQAAAARKKALVRKLTDRDVRLQQVDLDEHPRRWRDDQRLAALKPQKTAITTPKAIKRRIKVGEAITVAELARRMGVKANEVIRKLMALGMMVTINQAIDIEAATLIAAEFQYQVEAAAGEIEEFALKSPEVAPENLRPRAPVVTVMGHVDHGKTSLLDAIRETRVIEGEAGGITQAIGAYHVHLKDRDIVFLDTPGHEAFTAMRARGAQVTDIVILVVAADDGVMEQTVEAINHAKVAGVPIVVAVNKIDKPGANPGRIVQTLTEYGLVAEKLGGETIFCEVSAKKHIGIDELLENVLIQADVLELKADPDRPARGIVIESRLDRGHGPVATVLIQEGTLREGDPFVAKTEFGRVRAMVNDQGRRVAQAGPSMPVEVIGFSGVPQAGTEFVSVEDEKKARSVAEYWMRKAREKELSASSKLTLEQLYQKIREGTKHFNVILKADVQGSVEALQDAMAKLNTPDVQLKIIHSSAGAITETDIMLASASDAIIIGFNVRPDARVTEVAEAEGVEIKLYEIIYDVMADVKAAMEGLLAPEIRETVLGRAEVRELFRISKVGTVAGCAVVNGNILRNAGVKLVRDGVVVFDGKIRSLRRFKDDVKEVSGSMECGIGIEGFNDLKVGDIIEAYTREEVERKI